LRRNAIRRRRSLEGSEPDAAVLAGRLAVVATAAGQPAERCVTLSYCVAANYRPIRPRLAWQCVPNSSSGAARLSGLHIQYLLQPDVDTQRRLFFGLPCRSISSASAKVATQIPGIQLDCFAEGRDLLLVSGPDFLKAARVR